MKMGVVLGAICLAAAVVLFEVAGHTSGEVKKRQTQERLASLRVVLPSAATFSDLSAGSSIDYYIGYLENGDPAGYAFIGSARGYSGPIEVMVGIDPGGTLSGIDILRQSETPGLGDQAVVTGKDRSLWGVLAGTPSAEAPARPWFQEQFAGKKLKQLRVVKAAETENIQALTGATITSKAVVKAVRDSLEAFLRQQGMDGPEP
ncbi:MAG TPA: FMN-binding protein [bacterium]|nr:FMN-binding protein [bacterium]HPJ71753.1 FMN-binding protein [bacterium]HPQ65455.1 FMN-binding protein [bacterium]